MLSNKSKFSKEDNLKAQQNSEEFIHSNYKGIKSIQFNELYRTPMGGIIIEGIVNHEHKFSITLTEKLAVGRTIQLEDSFPERKEECKDKFCE